MPRHLITSLSVSMAACCVLLFALPAHAQTEYRVEKYNTLNGLKADHWVRSVQIDSSGMVWLALPRGKLARFDGQNFTFYPVPDSLTKGLPDNNILDMELVTKNLFLLPVGGKLMRFDAATQRFSAEPDVPSGIWVMGLYKNRFGGFIFQDEQDRFWLKIGGKWQVFDSETLHPQTLYDVDEGDDGNLWILAENGYHCFKPNTGEDVFSGFRKTPGNPFPPVTGIHGRDYLDSPPGFLWYADDKRLVKLDIQANEVETYNIGRLGGPESILEHENLRWYGTFDGLVKITQRVHLFDNHAAKSFDLAEGPPTNISCYGMTEDLQGNMYVATVLNQLLKITAAEPDTFSTIPVPQKLYLGHGILADKTDRLWLSIYNDSIPIIDLKTNSLENIPYPHDYSGCFATDVQGNIWIGYDEGVEVLDPVSKTFKDTEFEQIGYVWHLQRATDGAIWAATKNGVFKLKDGKILAHYHSGNTPGMSVKEIRSVQEHEGHLWCGTPTGLLRIDLQTGKAFMFTSKHGLPDDFVYCAIPAEGFLWCSTNNGLARIGLSSALSEKGGLLDVAIFTIDDGLPHFEFNSLSFYKARNGKLWFGGLNGLISFFPKDLVALKKTEHPMLITVVTKYDQQADSTLAFHFFESHPKAPFILRPGEQSFAVQFALLDYHNPTANQYAYLLEGFDHDWTLTGNQTLLRFNNLPSGKYTLRIRGADPNGQWSSLEAALPIIVQQAWYKTTWAWMAYAAVALALGFLVFKLRVRQLRLASQLQMEHAKSENLQVLERMKSRFFTNLTHEFRTPLTVILGMSLPQAGSLPLAPSVGSLPPAPSEGGGDGTADATPPPPSEGAGGRLPTEGMGGRLPSEGVSGRLGIDKKLTLIHRNAQNLLQLINQMLDLSKLEAGKMSLNLQQGEVVGYLKYLLESFHSLANAKNIRLHFLSDVEELTMDFDAERLQHIVSNLLSNAIKFTPEGGDVYFNLNSTAAEDEITLRVKDTGIGVAEDKLPFIFDRFYQADDGTTRQGEGTGIGLALVRELVSLMNGSIEAKSKPGKGTEFTVLLPVSRSPLTPKGEPPPTITTVITEKDTSALSASGFPLGIRGENAGHPLLLLIEDNADVVQYLQSCVEVDYRVAIARNGREGIEHALALVPDIIISDVMMPEKDGFEVCQTLKADERSSHIPIVLLTAKADVLSRIEGLKRGADAYLAKPFYPDELQVVLRNLVETRRRLQERYSGVALSGAVTDAISTTDTVVEDEFLVRLRTIVETNMDNTELSVEDLCKKIGMGRTNLHLKLTALTGMSVTHYVRSLRLHRAKELLTTTAFNVSEVAYQVGFDNPKYFTRLFSEEFGSPPSAFKKG